MVTCRSGRGFWKMPAKPLLRALLSKQRGVREEICEALSGTFTIRPSPGLSKHPSECRIPNSLEEPWRNLGFQDGHRYLACSLQKNLVLIEKKNFFLFLHDYVWNDWLLLLKAGFYLGRWVVWFHSVVRGSKIGLIWCCRGKVLLVSMIGVDLIEL